ncbi:MAG: EVE domain-containing protein [Cyclobacteriaceae bacterium]|nr:EVE domain-containing protein [Cyclobacteriaceae bacterium]MBX2956401.1 EVE domain-containing protein [Cyclobacteriaceae bacterium]
MNYWLLKTEPETYSWADLVRDKKTVWDGVKNFQARKNLKAMKAGDKVFIYHTGTEKSVAGIASVKKEAYPDPKDAEWVVVELVPEKPLKNSVALSTVKADKKLSAMALVKYARLSVQPVKREEFDRILELSEKK